MTGFREFRRVQYSDEERIDLVGLDEVDGVIWISENPNLKSIRLDARRVNGSVLISENPALESIEGFDRLEHVEGSLSIGGSTGLRTLPPMPSLTSAGSFDVMETSLTTLDVTPALRRIGSVLEISDNESLEYARFPVLEEIGWSLLIEDNPKFVEFQAPSLKAIQRYFGTKNVPGLDESLARRLESLVVDELR